MESGKMFPIGAGCYLKEERPWITGKAGLSGRGLWISGELSFELFRVFGTANSSLFSIFFSGINEGNFYSTFFIFLILSTLNSFFYLHRLIY